MSSLRFNPTPDPSHEERGAVAYTVTRARFRIKYSFSDIYEPYFPNGPGWRFSPQRNGKPVPPSWMKTPSATTTFTFKHSNFISTFGVRCSVFDILRPSPPKADATRLLKSPSLKNSGRSGILGYFCLSIYLKRLNKTQTPAFVASFYRPYRSF